MKRPRARYYDLSSLTIGARTDKPQTGKQVRIPNRKTKYKGQCPSCGGSKFIVSPEDGSTKLCPHCTGYQQCGL